MRAVTIEKAVAELVDRLTARVGSRLRSITLYGSWARGKARPASDIDVMVVVDRRDPPLTAAIHEEAQEVDLRHLTYLSVKICPQAKLEEMRRLRDPFVANIEREGRTLWTPTSKPASETA